MKKRGQVSVEFALLIGFVTFLLIAIIGIAYNYSGMAGTQIRVNSMDKVGKKLGDTIDSICYLGQPSKATIQLTVPEGVVDAISISDTGTNPTTYGIQFKVRIKGDAITDMFYKTQCEVNATDGIFGSDGTFTKAGLKSLQIESMDHVVEISKSH